LYGSLENVAVAIYHLQSNAAEASAVTTTEANASIKNLVYYADVYSKTPISSGFINNIKSANLSLENIFSAARINQYTKTDETTHKATDGKVIHTQPLLFNAINEAAITTIDAEANPKRYWLGITTAKNVFWLKRDKTNDFATEKNFMSVQDELQFKGYDPNATEFALQSGTSDIEPANTLSGCANAASCTSPWAPANQMKKITEPNGETISIPWMK
ncbi:MAG: hypothetical protein J6A01_11685, partial [Proteobacteria bacterium]|nr:hypothetical protein [Pseudomonadota bacterium]